MLRQLVKRTKRNWRCLRNTWRCDRGIPTQWRDDSFYADGVGDLQTVSKGRSAASSRHYFCSLEMVILRYFLNKRMQAEGASVVDLGPGAGHWIDFCLSLGAARVIVEPVGVGAGRFPVVPDAEQLPRIGVRCSSHRGDAAG